ncbi:hypothetical protein KC19_2G258500 [Ceratodon purpureus]|uniref:Uncharacterized protein n=1 Tax=Ceratodon purpureus TaxID=3225 RepID=A0A8T0J172_CERPU|nr:hypothetical protein KC19_2G258500 [Ceratodon purpureus]
MKYQRSESMTWRGFTPDPGDGSHEQERLLDPDTKRMARARMPSRLRMWCKPVQLSVVAVFLLLTLISLGTTYYYWQYSYAISGCSNSVAALPPERINHGNATHVWRICVVIVIGDDVGVPSFNRLPFWKLRRIFQRVLSVAQVPGEVGLVEPDLRNVLVRTDYTSLVCKLARDALGPAVKCESFLDLLDSEQRVNCKTLVVGHSTKYVEQACPAWTREIYYKEREVVYIDTPDSTQEPITLPEWRPTIVTAFSSNHFKYGLLLLRSIGKQASSFRVKQSYNVSVVAWTMDEFSPKQKKYLSCVIKELEGLGVKAEARKFPFEKYPVWMRLNKDLIAIHDGGKGEYAWKALMADIVLQERGFILWLDAGCRILTPVSLVESLDWVKQKGFGGHKSEGIVEQWTHIGQLKYFQADYRYIKRQRNCDASRMGFTLDSYTKLFRPWYECSITRQCIAPEGSDRYNHRQDQAALSVLSYTTGLYCMGLSDDVIRHTDNYGFDFYGGVDPTTCYKDPVDV